MNVELLELFCQSVADVGVLSWWSVSEDGKFQLEFAGTQLHLPPLEPGGPPCGTVALRLEGRVLLQFLRRGQDSVPLDWPRLLQADQIKPLRLTKDGFQFFLDHGSEAWFRQVQAHREGEDVLVREDLEDRPIRLILWAGEVGVAVAARRAIPVSHHGDLDWDIVPELVARWWNYWERYWQLRDSPDPLPWDYACEMTIPILD